MVDLPGPLRAALEAELDGYPIRELRTAADHLSQRYRDGHPAARPILSSPLDTAAYLTTRMPATYAAARQVFDRLAAALPEFQPRAMLDLGAGTGACTWAAADAFPSLIWSHLVDSSAAALAAAQRMLARTTVHVTQDAERLDRAGATAAAGGFDLAVGGFLLGELDVDGQDLVTTAMAGAASVVTLIEPGTPAGYRRVLRARASMVALGRRLLAPCPHEQACPLKATQDWCHFTVRLPRSTRHRQAKDGQLGYEDEKYAYVVTANQPPVRRSARILRHPQSRSGHVRMTVCTADRGIQDVTVSRRDRSAYQGARHANWGDTWEPDR